MSPSSTRSRIAEVGLFAVLRAPGPGAALGAVDALVAGGVTGIEITYSTPGAVSVIAETARRHGDRILLGAGTVTTPDQAGDAVAAGASFLVSPGTVPALARAMTATGAACMFGAMTPTEVMTAVDLGADVVKLFPASSLGPGYVRALRGPFPDTPLMPTGGVTAANLGDWLAAGALAVGAGSELCRPAAMASGDFAEIEQAAREFSAALRAARDPR